MKRFWANMQWLALAGLMVLAFVALPLAPGAAHTTAQIGIEVPSFAPPLSPSQAPLPCDGHHCAHGLFCCMSSCLALASVVVPADTLLPAPLFDVANILFPDPAQPNGFGVRPALPPPRAIV
jgi:hypothetical protein